MAVPLAGVVKVWLAPPSHITTEPFFLMNLNCSVVLAGTLTS